MEFFTEFTDKFESFIGVNFWTMLFAWINILILYLFLRKLLFKPVKNMIDSRQKEVDTMYDEAEASRTSAAKMKEEYEEKLKKAGEESDQILKNAVRRAQLKEEEILKDANEKAERTLERANEQVALEKKQAMALLLTPEETGGKTKTQLDKEKKKEHASQQEIRARKVKLKAVEADIAKVEARLGEIDAVFAKGEIWQDRAAALTLQSEQTEVKEKLDALYADWETLMELMEEDA